MTNKIKPFKPYDLVMQMSPRRIGVIVLNYNNAFSEVEFQGKVETIPHTKLKKIKKIKWATVEKFAKQLEKETVEKYGISLSWSSLLAYVPIVENHVNEATILVEKGWRDVLRKKVDVYSKNNNK